MEPTPTRRFSQAVFNNAYMLEVSGAVAAQLDGDMTATSVAQAAGVDRNLVALVLKRLLAADLIEYLPQDGRERPFVRHQSQYWEACRLLLEQTAEDPARTSPPVAGRGRPTR